MLILVRHGMTALNVERRLQGRSDAALNATGERQARDVGAHLGPLDVVISSPLRRARETAAALERRPGTEIEIDERWIELDYGEFEGRRFGDTNSELWERWRADAAFRPTGGESLLDVAGRVRTALPELFERAAGADVAVVSHVSPIKAAIAHVLDAPASIAWRTHLVTASICRIDVSGDAPVLLTFNEVPSHLELETAALVRRG